MKLKTSLFKKGLIISDLKRFWWISAVYTLALLFILPLSHYMRKFNITPDNYEWMKEEIQRELNFKSGISQVLLLIIPVIIGTLVFRYMQRSKSASLYHSMPVTRVSLYLNSLVSCSILFISPLILTTLVMLILNGISFLSAYYTAGLIFTWFLYSLLFGILFLAMTIFVGMFTGNSVAQIAFVYILNVLPVFLAEFIRMHLSKLLYGFDNYSDTDFYGYMPLVMLYKNHYDEFTVSTKIFFIALTIVLLVGGLIAFKLRKPETAGDIITFKPVKPLFIFGATFCGTLLGGAYFGALRGTSLSFLLFGYFVCSLISYIVVQMITNKSFKILNTWKGYIGYSLVIAALLLGIKFDIFGYVNKIPDSADVKEVYIGYNIDLWLNKDKPNSITMPSLAYSYDDNITYKDSKNIENIVKLHKLILDNRSTNGGSSYIAYKLRNGKNIIRKYAIDYDLYASALGPVYESKEYKDNRYPVINQNVNDLKYLEIHDNRLQSNPVIESDKVKLDAFKAAITNDIKKLDYQKLIAVHQHVLYIDVVDNKDHHAVSYELDSNFVNTMDWLKKEGLYEKAVIKPDDVASVVLQNSKLSEYSENPETAKQEKKVEITDKKLIQELLDLSLGLDYRKGVSDFNVSLQKDQTRTLYSFPMNFNEKVSPELQSYIDKIK